MSFFLGGELTPHRGAFIVLTTFEDINTAFFDGLYYQQTLEQLFNPQRKDLTPAAVLLRALMSMLVRWPNSASKDVYAVMCALKIPVYHLVYLLNDCHKATAVSFLEHASKRYTVDPPMKHIIITGHCLYKKSVERNPWFRYAHRVFCMTSAITRGFTRKVFGEDEAVFAQKLDRAKTTLYHRMGRLLEEVFGAKYKELCGGCILPSVFNLYRVLHGLDAVFYDYWFKPSRVDTAAKKTKSLKHMQDTPINKFEWFMAGKYHPLGTHPTWRLSQVQLLEPRCVMLTYPDTHTVIHINVLVAHVKAYSNERMRYAVKGKSLVHTVIKKKTMACSSYKSVAADECVPTINSFNFNIHGYDSALQTGLVTIKKRSRQCTFDKLHPVTVSHSRMSSNSFHHGVMDTYSCRWSLMKRFPKVYSKIKFFPVIKATDIGLIHRESVLINHKDHPERVADVLSRDIGAVAEVDVDIKRLMYRSEAAVGEILDNHVIGITKMLHFWGKTEAAEAVHKILTFDRNLIAFNPKTSKSEFADKSKFDSESRGKASKKIKSIDKERDRKGFLRRVGETFPDVFIDPSNTNSRGKWSVEDRLSHSPDRVFYSPFTTALLTRLKHTYSTQSGFSSFVLMLNMMLDEINRY